MVKIDRFKGNLILGSATTSVLYFLGGWDILLQALITLILLDYISGLLVAYIKKELSSKIGLIGIAKKIGILVLVAVSVVVGMLFEIDTARVVTCLFFVGNEGISIAENCAELGIPIPKKLLGALKQLKSEGDNDE